MKKSRLHPDAELGGLLESLYGPFAHYHHARHHDPNIPYHIILRTFQGRPLLAPHGRFRAVAAGVLAKARAQYESIRLYAYVAMSNHIHLQLQGMPNEIPKFIAYVKRELTNRWGLEIGWTDTIWKTGYISTALPTAESQMTCFRYILSHGVKEKITGRAEDWTGLHVAREIATGELLAGEWLDGTRYSKALWKQRQKPADKRQPIDRAAFTEPTELMLAPLPAWAGLSAVQRQTLGRELLAEIAHEGVQARGGEAPLGMEWAGRVSYETRYPLPPAPPWFEQRQRLICWADPAAPETIAHVRQYWQFQLDYRVASDAYLRGDRNVEFPDGAFLPPVFKPPVEAAAQVS